MDDFVDFGWKEAYWPFWIFFSILIGLSFSVFLIMTTKLCAYAVYRKDLNELVTVFWLFYFVDGFTLMICLFVIHSTSYLIQGQKTSFIVTLIAFVFYSLIGTIFTQLARRRIVDFILATSSDTDENTSDAAGSRQTTESGDLKKSKEKKNIEIPEYLFKYSSTFFKTATKKDILFKKLFNGIKSVADPKIGPSSARDLKKGMSPAVFGKALKKTDMSMVNFHLEIKNNDELMKHYRSMSYNRERAPEAMGLNNSGIIMNEPQLKPQASTGEQGASIPAVKKQSMNETMNNLCGVCFATEPDSVFMKCGHGGICYECAIDIWKSTGECYLCREEIEQILQVEPQKDENGNEYLKVIASTQLVDEDDPDDNNSKLEYANQP